MAGKLEYLTKSLLNQPLLADEETVRIALDFLDNRWNFQALDFAGPTRSPSKDVSEGRVAQINMIGPMMKRAMGMDALCGAVDYETYRAQFDSAFDNPNVEVVVMYSASGGGDAAGVFDLAQHINAKKKESGKKLIGYTDEISASAAYAFLSVCDEIYMEQNASVGSIGVITTHVDMSKKLEKDGVTVTPIYAGQFKAAGNPFEELSDETKAMIQERVDALYTNFVQHVAEMRSMSEQAVRDTEARVFLAKEAVELGLADGIMSVDEFMAYLEDDEDNMPTFTKTKPQEKAVTEATVDMASYEAMQAELADLKQKSEQLEAFEAKQAEMATEMEQYKALLEQKEKAEYEAKLEGFKEQAKAWTSLGVDADAFAAKAMEADSELVAMVSAALDSSVEKLEESPDFKEVGTDIEGEGMEHPEKKSGVMAALESKYTKESK